MTVILSMLLSLHNTDWQGVCATKGSPREQVMYHCQRFSGLHVDALRNQRFLAGLDKVVDLVVCLLKSVAWKSKLL